MDRRNLVAGKISFLKSIVIIYLLISSFVFLIFCTNFIIDTVSADSNSYYVANDGSDSRDGMSPATAWKTISKVNTEFNGGFINQGDDIFFKRSDVFSDDYLSVKVGGTSSDYMVFGAYGSGDRPVFNDNVGGYNIRFATANVNYVTIQDLSLENSSGTSLVANTNLTNITISNVAVKNSGWNAMFFDNTIGLWIKNCTVINAAHSGIVLYGSIYNRLSNVLVENTFVNGSGTDDAFMVHRSDENYDVGSNFLFYNCTGTGFGEQAFDISSGENILLIDCEGYGNGDSSIVLGWGVRNVTITGFYSHDETVNPDTRGFIFGNCNQIIVRDSIIFNSRYYHMDVTSGTENFSFYNNNLVFDGDSRDTSIITMASGSYNLIFKNNIILSLNDTKPTNRFLRYLSPASLANTISNWSHNIWWRGDAGAADDRWWTDDNVYQTYVNWLAKDQVDGDLRVDPLIDDPANGCWNLSSGSPAIDAGVWLTQTVGSGTGTTITLDDASYFIDGYGLIDGDEVFVGDDSYLKIVDVDYDSNEITINRSITWVNGENVSLLSYHGDSVDIGANDFTQIEQAPDWDINQDGLCNILDYTLISNQYGETGENGWIREDVDNNGEINILDFVLISNHYGENW